MNAGTIRTKPLPPEIARELVVDLEHLGLDADDVVVHAQPPLSTRAASHADQVTISRPGRRVAAGAAIGLAVGLILGLLVAAIWSLGWMTVVLPAAMIGLILGGLSGLYRRLAMSPEAYDVGGGARAIVEIKLEGHDGDDKASDARRLVAEAEQKR